jgi:hypothetical protein
MPADLLLSQISALTERRYSKSATSLTDKFEIIQPERL